jgi:hypothetical protein
VPQKKSDQDKATAERDALAKKVPPPIRGAAKAIADRRRRTDDLARKIAETDRESQDVKRLK